MDFLPCPLFYLILTDGSKVNQIQFPESNVNQFAPVDTIIATIAFDTQQELLWIGTDHV